MVSSRATRKARAIPRGDSTGEIPGVAILLFLQLGDSGGQVRDLVNEVLALLSQQLQQVSQAGWGRVPLSVGNTSGWA